MKKTILIAWLLFLGLTPSSCNAVFPSEESDSHESVDESDGFRPTPGYNSSITIAPTTPGQPTLWAAWNLNGNMTSTTPTSHSVFLGSNETDFLVGGASADEDTSYTLLITDLTGSNPSATLTPEGGAPSSAQAVAVTSIQVDTETFAVSIRETNPPSANLYLCVTQNGGGVKIVLGDA